MLGENITQQQGRMTGFDVEIVQDGSIEVVQLNAEKCTDCEKKALRG
jgi:hypothetical protein